MINFLKVDRPAGIQKYGNNIQNFIVEVEVGCTLLCISLATVGLVIEVVEQFRKTRNITI